MTDRDDDFNCDEFFDAEMAGIEQRHDLERTLRTGLDIERAMADAGPLAGYMKERRRLALEALDGLVSIEPSDAVQIAVLQATVREYLNVRTWVRRSVADAATAKEILREEFDGSEEGRESNVED